MSKVTDRVVRSLAVIGLLMTLCLEHTFAQPQDRDAAPYARETLQPSNSQVPNSISDNTVSPQPMYGIGTGMDGGELIWDDSLASAACPPRWYAVGDAFALVREGGERTTLSQAFSLPDWDFQLFGRLTAGYTRDCLNGWEVTYIGGGKWRNTATATGTDLDSRLVAGIDIDPADLQPFNNAVFHSQQYESELHSAEVMRKWFGWDVISVSKGVRWIRLDDEFAFFSINGTGDTGLALVDLQNDLILAQLRLELMRPLGSLTYGGKLAGGIGLNFNNGLFRVTNNGNPVIDNFSDSEEFAYTVEAGYFAYYRVTPCITARVGYEGLLIGGLALANEQIRGPLTSASGLAFEEHGVIFVHGGFAGVEVVW